MEDKLEEKAKEFKERESVLTPEKYYELKEDLLNSKITPEEFDNILNKTEVKFDNKEDFIKFTNSLARLFNDTAYYTIFFKGLAHELVHSMPYEAKGITSCFGWHKFKSEKKEEFGYKAFHEPTGKTYEDLPGGYKARLRDTSFKMVEKLDKLSKSDTLDWKWLKKEYPELSSS